MPDLNPGPLPQKSGALPMSHHIYNYYNYVIFHDIYQTRPEPQNLLCSNYGIRTFTAHHGGASLQVNHDIKWLHWLPRMVTVIA